MVKNPEPIEPPSRISLWHWNKELKTFERKVFLVDRNYQVKRTFEIRRDEPLVKYFLDWVDVAKKAGDENILDRDYYYWYGFFKALDPMTAKYPERVRWTHIYPHWFRAQRVS